MATPDDTTTAPAADDSQQLVNSLLGRVLTQPRPVTVDTTPVDRSWMSLLGEALAGHPQIPMSPAAREAAGARALGDFGTSLMAASRYSPGQTLWSNLAGGFQGAQQSELQSQQTAANYLAAQQAYQQQQQEMQLARIKEAMPLLTLKTQMDQAKAAAGVINAPSPGTAGAKPGDLGVPVAERNTSITAGQQGNNPGNIMMTPGANIPGAVGAIPVSGGRYVASFPDVPTAVAAHSDLLNSYQANGVNTIRGAVTRWVGDPKADLTSYVNDVTKAAGVDPDAKVDLTDPKIQRAFILAQQPHESGKTWLSGADVDKGLALADARRKGAKPGTPAAPATAAATPAPVAAKPAAATPPATPAPAATAAPDVAQTGVQVAGPGAPTSPTVAPPSPAVAGDVNAIIQGMTRAGASPETLAPPGAPAPPPGGTQVAAAAPAPGSVPAQTGGLVVPPGVTPPPGVTTTPPAPETPPQLHPDIKVGGLTFQHPGDDFEAYYAKNKAPTPTSEDYNPNLSPQEQAKFAADQAGLDQQKKLIGTFPFAERAKESMDWSQKQTALNAAIQQRMQEKAAGAAAKINTWDQDQRKAVQTRYEKALGDYGAAAQSELATSQETRKSELAAQLASRSKIVDKLNTDSQAAHDSVEQLQALSELSHAAGAPSLLPEGVREWLVRTGTATPEQASKWSAQAALDAANQRMITSLRNGTGFQRTTNMDLEFLTRSSPGGSWSPEEFRDAKTAFLMSAYRHQMQYADEVNTRLGDGMKLGQAQTEADKAVGPIIRSVPSNDALTATYGDSPTNKDKWIFDNVSPGEFYKDAGGRLKIFTPRGKARPE